LPARLVLSVVAQGLEAAWALLNSLVAFEVSAWVGFGFGIWAVLAALACGLSSRRRRAAIILSAGLQAVAAVVGAIFLIAAPDVRAVGGVYLLVGGVLFWAFWGVS
jgi:hypothetical protein